MKKKGNPNIWKHGGKGGRSTVKKYGLKYMRKIARRGGKKGGKVLLVKK